MKVRFERVPKDRPVLRPQARRHDPEYLARLADSLVKGQLQPIGLLRDMTVVWGTGRVLAGRMKPEITHLLAAVLDEEVTEREFLRLQAVENFARNELTNAEKCRICTEYAKSEPGMTLKQIAADLGVDASMVTRWMSWENCIEPVQQALTDNRITLQAMYILSQLPQGEQVAALEAALNAPNTAAVMRAVRKQRNGTSTVRTARVKCAMPSGVTVTLAGEGDGLTLDDVIETLLELLKAAKKANDEGLDSKTFQAVLKDRAKAG